MKKRLAAWSVPASVCLALYWSGLTTWFALDDFAWLGLRLSIFDFDGLLEALFAPKAQGTIRPLSERAYFLILERLFGLEALPFRMVAFGTQLVNIWLLMRLGERLTGRLAAGMAAATLWILHSSLSTAMSWSSAYNQILWPCFVLAAINARWRWLMEENRSARAAEWMFFLLGFGALELNVIYPALALALTWLYRREKWREVLPLFAVSICYTVLNRMIVPKNSGEVYRLHWDSSIVQTLGVYLRLALGAWVPDWPQSAWEMAGEIAVGACLVLTVAWMLWRRDRVAIFGVAWMMAGLSLVLPLKNHITPYYLTMPSIGLALVAGWAVALRPIAALVPAVLYAASSGYMAWYATDYHAQRASMARTVVLGVRQASELHGGKLVLLTDVRSDQYWFALNDSPFRLIPGVRAMLAPGVDESIEAHPELGNPSLQTIPPAAAIREVDAGRAVVYSAAGERLSNVTAMWKHLARARWDGKLARVLNIGKEYADVQLGEGWYAPAEGARWMSQRGTLRLAPPEGRRTFFLEAGRTDEEGKRGSVELAVRVGTTVIGNWTIPQDNQPVVVSAALPADLTPGKPLEVTIEVSPPFVEADGRKLGLYFGSAGIR